MLRSYRLFLSASDCLGALRLVPTVRRARGLMQRKLYSDDDKVGTGRDLEVTRAALQVECKRQRLLKQQILQQMHALALEYTLHDVRLCLSLIHKLHQRFCLVPRLYMPSAEWCRTVSIIACPMLDMMSHCLTWMLHCKLMSRCRQGLNMLRTGVPPAQLSPNKPRGRVVH